MLGRRRVTRPASGLRFTLVPTFACLLAAAACSGSDGLMGPSTSPLIPTRPVASISDATQGAGNPHFYWLPPIAPAGTYAGTFDPGLQPTIKICRLASLPCTTPLVTIAPGSIKVDATAQSYSAKWSTSPTNITVDDYRAEVWIGSRKMGFADIRVVAKQKDVHTVPTGFVGVAQGNSLTLAFRLEFGIVASINIAPSNPAIDSGTTVQLSATAVDFHSQIIQNAAVTWSSAAASIASVNSAGLVTGVAPGTAVITASSGGVSATDTITVRRPTVTTTGGYRASKQFTIDHTQVGGSDLADFTVLVKVTNPEFATVAYGGRINNLVEGGTPADFVFSATQDGRSVLDFKIIIYDASTGTIWAWVHVPSVSSIFDTAFYAAYDDPSVTVTLGDNVHTFAAYQGVYMMEGGYGIDSSPNALHATVTGATSTPGQIEDALAFTQSASRLETSTSALLAITSNGTLSAWVNPSDWSASNATIFKKNGNYILRGEGTNLVAYYWDGTNLLTASCALPSTGSWHKVDLVIAANAIAAINIDNVSQTLTRGNLGAFARDASQMLTIGNQPSPPNFLEAFIGSIDQATIASTVARTAGWLTAEYNNQKSGSTFITVH
jgi:hypothetical protein